MNSGESGATNLGPRSKVLLSNTKALVAYWHQRGVNPTPDLVTTSGSGYRPRHHRRPTPWSRSRWSPRPPGSLPSTLRALIAQENNSAQLGFLGSSYINVLQLNEALVHLR